MPFGLTNAPAVFQHLMNDIFRDMLDHFVVIYLDDILVYSPSRSSHSQHLRRVLQRLREHRLFAKLEKCQFYQTTIEFLGHIISPEGITMDPGKVETLNTWQPPQRGKDVQRLLGFANYYRTFIPGFATMTAPLTRLLQKKVPFQWGKVEQEAFTSLKEAFKREPILQHPDPHRPFVVEADASDVAVGAVLLQARQDGGRLFPCAYYSRKLTSSERHYTIWEKELLAIKTAFETWRHHLEGARHQVEVRTDHRNLEFLQTARKLNQRQIRWSFFFSRFNFRIRYTPSWCNPRADALSRKPEYLHPKEPVPLQTILPAEALAATHDPVDLRRRIREAQQQDDFVTRRKQELSPDSPWMFSEGMLRYRGKLYVPAGPLRRLVLTQCHDSPSAGHFGHFKTFHLVSQAFWWPRLRDDVHSYVTTCVRCRQAKTVTGPPAGLLQPLPTPERPWGAISLDFVTHLPNSSGFTTVLVVVDMLTKMAHFIPCRRVPTAQVTARLFIQQVFRLHGLPDKVVSDRGAQFTAKFWKELMTALNVQICLASTHHPQTDGGTEKVIGILEQYLRCFVHDRQKEWAQFLPVAEFAFNNSQHTSTQTTPFFANYGYHPRFFPLTLLDSPVPAAGEFLSELHSVQEMVKRYLNKAKEDYKKYADRFRRDVPPLAVGDHVWLATKYLSSETPRCKLDPRFMGPFPVEQVINPVAYRLTLPASLKVHPVFHRSLLVPVSPDCQLRSDPPISPASCVRDRLPESEIVAIRDSRWLVDCFQYLVEWAGRGPDNCSWVEAAFVDAPALIRTFHLQFPWKPRPLRRVRGRGLPVGDSVVVSLQPAPVKPDPLISDSESEDEASLGDVPGSSGEGPARDLAEGEVSGSPVGVAADSALSSDEDPGFTDPILDARVRRWQTRQEQLHRKGRRQK